jgi:hypothetical protein
MKGAKQWLSANIVDKRRSCMKLVYRFAPRVSMSETENAALRSAIPRTRETQQMWILTGLRASYANRRVVVQFEIMGRLTPSLTHQHAQHRTAEPYYADADASLHMPYERVLQEPDEPHSLREPVLYVVQLRPPASDASCYPSYGSWLEFACVVYRGDRFCRRIETRFGCLAVTILHGRKRTKC